MQCGTPEIESTLYVYDPTTKEVVRDRTVPWFVEFVLTKFSKKHVWPTTCKPKSSDFTQACTQFYRKLAWKMHFASVQDHEQNQYWGLKPKGLDTPVCPHPIPDIVSEPMFALLSRLWEEFEASRIRFSYAKKCTPSIVSLAFGYMKSSQWSFWASDKDNGFVLIDRAHLKHLKDLVIQKPEYSLAYQTEDDFRILRHKYGDRCQKLAKAFGDHKLASMLAPKSDQSPISHMDLTIKTHKPPGLVVPRNVHCSSNHIFTSGMKLIEQQLRAYITGYQHILRDSGHMLNQLKDIPIPHRARLIKVDVKEFFMSGDHPSLTEHSFSHIADTELRDNLEKFAYFILDNQFVSVEIGDSKPTLLKVLLGAGMGLLCSGSIADVSFLHMAEKSYVLDPDVRAKYKLVYYARFKDDIILVMDDQEVESIMEFFDLFRQHSSFFRLEVESVPRTKVQMLDVLLQVQTTSIFAGYPLVASPFKKPTSQWVPLTDKSMHPMHVHQAWPTAYLQRLSTISSTQAIADAASLEFVHSLKSRCSDHIYFRHGNREKRDRGPPANNHGISDTRFVLPYFFGCRPSAFAKLLATTSCMIPTKAAVCWKLGGIHNIRAVKRLNKKEVG